MQLFLVGSFRWLIVFWLFAFSIYLILGVFWLDNNVKETLPRRKLNQIGCVKPLFKFFFRLLYLFFPHHKQFFVEDLKRALIHFKRDVNCALFVSTAIVFRIFFHLMEAPWMRMNCCFYLSFFVFLLILVSIQWVETRINSIHDVDPKCIQIRRA